MIYSSVLASSASVREKDATTRRTRGCDATAGDHDACRVVEGSNEGRAISSSETLSSDTVSLCSRTAIAECSLSDWER